MTLPRFLLDKVKDEYVRDNFRRVKEYLAADIMRKMSFQFFEWELTDSGTYVYPHSLGFQPLDVVQLSVRRPDTATVVWNYDDFTATNVSFTVSAACTVRALIGRYGST